ncbi:MAG: hypothetical protein ABJB22_04275 [Verrucomicrobiota bacterium]
MKRLLAPSLLFLSAAVVLAQDATATPEDAASPSAAAAAGLAACGMGMLLFPLIILAVNIALMIWVGKDAKARGMDNHVLWMVLTFFLGILGWIIYLLVRPKTTIPPTVPPPASV